MRVLLVDDEASLRMTLAANLELEGFTVAEARSGPQALELLREQAFDLVLSDVRMPGMNGVELFKRIRADHPEMPVVLMTAFSLEELVRDAVEHGVFAVLAKPFRIDHVVATLLRAGRRGLVLVVDDAPLVAEATATVLRGAGLRAEAAKSAAEAVDAVTRAHVDVCVLDLVLPDADGVEVMRRIRAIDARVAFIAVSCHDVPELMRRVAAAGAFACMRKPFQPGELIDAIGRARGNTPPRVGGGA